MSYDYDVIIIGAGMSGLAAGIRLAYFEKKVLILEKHYAIGGLNSLYRLKGYSFDVGLHAMTNYVPKGSKGTPLIKLLKQLRLAYEDFDLCPQEYSTIQFPQKTLRFSNDFELLRQEVAQAFPHQIDAFNRFVSYCLSYDEVSLTAKPLSASEILQSYFSDPLLIDMLLLPLMYYGSAVEGDMEFGQFVIMFKSIFCEGFARPQVGVRQILILLKKKYEECGGHLKMRCGVERLLVQEDRVTGVQLETGEILTAEKILSSAGYPETMRLCEGHAQENPLQNPPPGVMTFMESISVLDCDPQKEMGHQTTIVFFNCTERFHYKRAQDLIDVNSGVICCPNNFRLKKPLPHALIRVTNIANFDRWNALEETEYLQQKEYWYQASLAKVTTLIPDFRSRIIFQDIFTPKTIKKFTGHLNGAVYGCPEKRKDGTTHLKNLFLCGTDQGFLGIIGAMLSGISMANLHTLK